MEQQKCEFATLKVLPPELLFEVREGSQFIPGYQYIFVDKDKPGLTPNWAVAGSHTWLRLSTIGSNNVRVGCASVGMAAGVYHATAEVTSHVEVKDPVVQITLTVHPKDAPTPPAPPPDPEPPEPPPEPPPPEPEPEPPPPEPEPPKPPEEKDWFMRFLEWLMEQLEKIWKH